MIVTIKQKHIDRAIQLWEEWASTPNHDPNYLVPCLCPTSLALDEKLGRVEGTSSVETYANVIYIGKRADYPLYYPLYYQGVPLEAADEVADTYLPSIPLHNQIVRFSPAPDGSPARALNFKPGKYKLTPKADK